MLAMTAKPELAHETIPNVLPLPLKRRVASNGIVIDGPSQLTPSVYAPREDLFLEGDDATHLVEVVEGVVILVPVTMVLRAPEEAQGRSPDVLSRGHEAQCLLTVIGRVLEGAEECVVLGQQQEGADCNRCAGHDPEEQ